MEESIGRLATKAGVNDAVAEKAIGIIPGFLHSEALLMAARHKLPGFGIGGIQNACCELLRFGRNKIGTDGIALIVAETPDLVQIA
jgi:hypothetical protein